MSKTLPVIAVVTNFNMAKSLDNLLYQIEKQNYDSIYVLDDKSTDNSLEVAKKHKGVKIIEGKENRGAAANRNRIIPEIKQDSLLHFLDADVSLVSSNNPDKCQQLFEDNHKLGLAGGLVATPDKVPFMFNYGPAFSFYSWLGGALHVLAHWHGKKRPLIARLTKWWRKEFTDPFAPLTTKKVFWVAEGNMVIPSEVFRRVNGFDPKLRFHEAQDISIKLYKAGYYVMFTPDIAVEHPFINPLLTSEKRKNMNKAHFRLIKNYGLHFKNLL